MTLTTDGFGKKFKVNSVRLGTGVVRPLYATSTHVNVTVIKEIYLTIVRTQNAVARKGDKKALAKA
tara:strand:- start:217 stop:414 length:198 start_codon:yes stop_codon:yes gene_type:complete